MDEHHRAELDATPGRGALRRSLFSQPPWCRIPALPFWAGLLFLFASVYIQQEPAHCPTPLSRLDLLHALAHGHVQIDAYRANTPDVAQYQGHYYSDKAPGTVVLAWPAFAASGAALRATGVGLDSKRGWLYSSWAATVGSNGIEAALGVALLLVWLSKHAGAKAALITAMAVYMGAAPLPYATMMFSHALVVGLISIALWSASKCGMGSAECGMQEAKPGMGSAECGMQEAKPGMRSAECGMQEAKPGMGNAECGMEEGEGGVRNGECGVRNGEGGMEEGEGGVRSAERGLRSEEGRGAGGFKRRDASHAEPWAAATPLPHSRLCVWKGLHRLCVVWVWAKANRWGLLAGFACGWALASEYTSGLIVIGIGLWLMSQGWRRLIPFCLAAIPPLLLIPLYSWLCFRHPFVLPYSLNASFPEMKQGLYAIKWPDAQTAFNLLFSPARGLFFWSPFLVMAGVGYWDLAGKDKRLFWLTYAVPVLQIVVISGRTWDWPAGPTIGPRYLAPILPLLALPCALGLRRFPKTGMFLAAYSIVTTSLATLTNASPPFPTHPNPLLDLNVPMFLRGQFQPNLGTAAGLPPFLSVALYYAILVAGMFWLWRLSTPDPATGEMG